jgi:hypothetical protein
MTCKTTRPRNVNFQPAERVMPRLLNSEPAVPNAAGDAATTDIPGRVAGDHRAECQLPQPMRTGSHRLANQAPATLLTAQITSDQNA